MRPHERRLLAVAAVARVCMAAGTIQLAWTTDSRVSEDGFNKTFGPDGPWQAVAVFPGDFGEDYNGIPGVPVPMWPSGSGTSEIPQAAANYSPEDSDASFGTDISRGMTDTWFSPPFANLTSIGDDYYDIMALPDKTNFEPRLSVNASIVSAYSYWRTLPDGREVDEQVGILGLGPNTEKFEDPDDPGAKEYYPSILEQLQSDGEIGSASFGFHVASAGLDQPGSLILGGYDKNRVIGRAGVFKLYGIPYVPLVDITLGVETGGSPFDSPDPISVYPGITDDENAVAFTREYGAKKGAAIVVPNPVAPYLYLPPGTCEEAAKHLPVTLDEDLGVYLWDTSDPQFERIVTSPAYLAFTLSDMTATNITIKVPFALLNLTLTEPLADKPTPYFPCRSMEAPYAFWMLGRAFLQAAFMAVNFDSELLFLAQAPGPGMEQSVIQELGDGDEALEELAEGKFAESWADTWTELPGGDGKLSGGAIAGIAVGAVAGVAGAALAAFFFLRRRRARAAAEVGERPASKEGSAELAAVETEGTPVQEMGEAKPRTPEMDAPSVVHEAPEWSEPPVELPASSPRAGK